MTILPMLIWKEKQELCATAFGATIKSLHLPVEGKLHWANKNWSDGYNDRPLSGNAGASGTLLHQLGQEARQSETKSSFAATLQASPFGNVRNAAEAEIIAHGLLRVMATNQGRHEEAGLRTRAIELICLADKWGQKGRNARAELVAVRAQLKPYDDQRMAAMKANESDSSAWVIGTIGTIAFLVVAYLFLFNH